MAPSFVRSISFPLPPARSSSKPCHVRAISLPSSSHPLLAHLNAHIADVRSWIQDPASVVSGFAHIHALHAALADFLLLQDPQDLLRRARGRVAADHLLDAFLLLADAHQGFQESLLEFRHAAAEIRAALCRGDTARVASAATSQRRAEKKISRVASSVSTISSKCARLNIVVGGEEEVEMTGALMEAVAASAVASGAVFLAAASMSAATLPCKKTAMFPVFARKAAASETAEAALERFLAMERCFDECDGVCDKVFRSIVQTRVSLLNLTTPAM